jgi:hypothetical protein
LNNQDSQEKKKGKESILRLDDAEKKVKRRTRKQTGREGKSRPLSVSLQIPYLKARRRALQPHGANEME